MRIVCEDTLSIALPAWVDGANHNLVAALLVLAITALLCLGIRIANNFNAVVVAIKLTVILLVIVAGLFFVEGGNLDPFIPPSGSTPAPGGESSTSLLQDIGINTGTFGIGGIFSAAALVFFAYIGFDVVATAPTAPRRCRSSRSSPSSRRCG